MTTWMRKRHRSLGYYKTLDDSPYLSSDLSNRHFPADQNPLHQRKWRAAMYCIISSTRKTEMDQRRFAKKAQQISHSWTVGNITLALLHFSGWAVSCPLLLWTIPLGGSGEGLLPPAILLCMCATVVYPPGLLHCMKGRLSFILRWRGRPLEEIPILNIKIELCFD
jgi:hypothetical protein